MVLLCMLNMGVQVQICAREVIWMVYNNRKPTNFCDILYCLKVIFLQRVFEALNNVFSYSKTPRTECTKCTKVHFVSAAQMKRSQREISNGVNRSSNKAFMRKLQDKQWRVNFKTQLTSKGHNFLLWNQIEAQEKSMEIY
jgi:hypothetical protein